MRSTSAVYVSSSAECDKYKEGLKHVPCPHCRVVGCLIGHGYLWGKGDKGYGQLKRGRRTFCSDRNLRKGCGRTFAVIEAGFLYHRMVEAKRLWGLLMGVAQSQSIKAAWEKVSAPFCLETGYHLWQAFRKTQTFIRTRLLRARTPPRMHSHDPTLQVIEHLRSVFSQSVCPVCAFQVRFQTAFLHAPAPRINRSG